MSSANAGCAVYVGNLDDRVSERVLYDILIQAGRVVDLYIPRDKETNRAKGYAFAEYETEEIADYAVKLFSGLVTLHKRTLKFAISGQDKPPATSSTLNSSVRAGPPPVQFDNTEVSPHLARSAPSRFSERQINNERVLPGVVHQSNEYRSHFDGNNYDYSRRVFGGTIDSINRSRSSCFDTSVPIKYPFH
ncbi:Splicing factor 3B subunit like [Actinidia chinensis var. chinensis]|uniref:Splicing factor 3B subunit like n=1 Tax=Actinidia chinensis var. chinensis TaxID=1590841 RepID=A0A2R6QYT9_ACTCC|nr:Splicing factor 3B subunit like [Actinidia chinensis var. chinensis]